MKVELPPFNGNVSIEEYLDSVSEAKKFLIIWVLHMTNRYGGLQIERRSICLVGSCSIKPYS